MRNATYLLINLLIFLPVLILSFKTDVKPHKHPVALLAAFLLVSVPFIFWDIWAVSAGHWGFNGDYILGPELFGMPIEEWLFFITVPFAMIYTWGVVKKFVADKPSALAWPFLALGIVGGVSVWFLLNYWGNGYTRTVSIAALVTVLLLLVSRLAYTARFWTFQLLLVALFLIFNSILTSIPIITYGSDAIIGFKVGTIPIEDFLFSFAFVNLFLLVFHSVDQPRLFR
jgi:lycopene cyclase domain-containing protein